MAAITTEDLINNICTLCKMRRTGDDIDSRVLSKDELLILQSVLLRQKQELDEIKNEKNKIENIVQETLLALRMVKPTEPTEQGEIASC